MINYSRKTNIKHELGLNSFLPKIKTAKVYNYESAFDIRELKRKRKSTVERNNSIKKSG